VLWFDEADYLTRHPDLRAAVDAGRVPSGWWHYRLHGRHEGRAAVRRWPPPSWHASLLTVVRPRPHWSGLSLVCRRSGIPTGRLVVSVYAPSIRGLTRVRQSTLAIADIDVTGPVPVYWAPLADPSPAFYVVTVTQLAPDGQRHPVPPLSLARLAGRAALVYSEPAPEVPLPEALLFSPVTQCNLNCIHCISRESRRQVAALDDTAWETIAEAVRAGHVRILRSDYSGDLLFSDRRHGRWLDRVIALDIPYAIDTHANDLDASATRRLLASRLSPSTSHWTRSTPRTTRRFGAGHARSPRSSRTSARSWPTAIACGPICRSSSRSS
jgi:hypothetical protein